MNKKIFNILLYTSLIFILISLPTPHFEKIFISFIVLIIIFLFFWRDNTPPIIVAALSYQWLTITVGYIYISITDSKIIDLLWRPQYSLAYIDKSFWLSIIGLFFFALGLKFAILNLKEQKIYLKDVEDYNLKKIIILYSIFTFLGDPIFSFIRYKIPGLAQPINMVFYFKWSLLYIMLYIAAKQKKYLQLIYAILLFEILIGFSGYFSEFKNILIMLPIVYLTFNKIKGAKQTLFILLFFLLLFNLGAIWSYVKVDYRMFLSGGERAQKVTVSKKEALEKLVELTSKMNIQSYQKGIESMIKRIFALEYFSATINYIPKKQDFFQGENWNRAIKHIIMPRILFPNKEVIDDSKQTYKLTGIQVADSKHGTSISVGYMAEAYADYGPIYMFIPIFLLGFVTGQIYKYFVKKNKNIIWSYALIFPTYFLININGKNIIKIMGNLFMYFLVFYSFQKILPTFDKFLKKEKLKK